MTDEEQIRELEQKKKVTLLEKEIAEAEQVIAKSRREEAAATAAAERDATKAAAVNDKDVAEAEKLAAQARRDLASGDDVAARDKSKAGAETAKAVAEARAAALKAVLPGEAKLAPLEGTVTADAKAGHLAEVVAHAMVVAASEAVAKELGVAAGKRYLVVEDRDLAASDWARCLVTSQLARSTTELTAVKNLVDTATISVAPTVTPPTPDPRFVGVAPAVVAAGGAAIVIRSLVGAAADVLGYITSDYTIAGRTITASDPALTAALVRALRSLPEAPRISVDRFRPVPAASGLVASFDRVAELRWEITTGRIRLQLDELAAVVVAVSQANTAKAEAEAALAALAPDAPLHERQSAQSAVQVAGERLLHAETNQAAITSVIDIATAAETRADAIIAELATVPDDGGLPPLGLAVLREQLDGTEMLDGVLVAAIDSIGGETITRKNRFLGPAIRYVGSCQVTALLVATKAEGTHAVGDIIGSATAGYTGSLTLSPRSGKYTDLATKRIAP